MSLEHVREGLRRMAAENGPPVSNIALVKSVDLQNATCVLEDEDGLEIFDVRLRPVINGSESILIVPKINTYVLAMRIEDQDEWFVVGYDEITLFSLKAKNSVLEISESGFLLKKENETLKKIMVDLVKAIKNLKFVVTTPAGPGNTTTIVNLTEILNVEQRIETFLK